MRYDLLAVDLDGTLLDTQHALVPENRAALHRAHDAGLKIVLCTGRAYAETRPVIARIGLDLDATVTVFGAVVTDVATGRTLSRTAIPLDIARAAVAWLQQEDYAVLWLTDPNETGDDGFTVYGTRCHTAVERWMQRTPCLVRHEPRVPPDAAAPIRLTIIDEHGSLRDVSQRLTAAFDGRLVHNVLDVTAYDLALIEAFAAQVNKWYGITQLCQRWGIDPARTVAVGDDVNDLDMIRNAGLGVAIGNAKPIVRETARLVVPSNDEGGVARLVERILNGD